MTEIFYETKDIAKSLLTLNSMVLMQDDKCGYGALFDLDQIPKEMRNYNALQKRFYYLLKKKQN